MCDCPSVRVGVRHLVEASDLLAEGSDVLFEASDLADRLVAATAWRARGGFQLVVGKGGVRVSDHGLEATSAKVHHDQAIVW